jgi:1-acyl-sn-glycerol-3-phosphate acyltransferase
MLYDITKPIIRIALSVYFRKVYLSNKHRIPKDKPVILAANHPTAFIEPCILACWLTRPLSFVARGDLYLTKPFVRKLYDWYRLIPVFRIDDAGYGHLKSNYESFGRCVEALMDKKMLMILAEGRTKHEKRLRPLMKGTARIVFDALAKYPGLDIHVIPVGVNYTDSDTFRSSVMIDFGEPLRALDYLEKYGDHPAKCVNALTADLGKGLKERVIHIADPDDDDWVEQLLVLERNEHREPLLPVSSPDAARLFAEKQRVDFVNQLSQAEKNSLKKRLDAYLAALSQKGVTDFGIQQTDWYSLGNSLLLGIFWLPQLLGWLLNALPLWVAGKLSRKLAASIEFRAALAIPFGVVAYGLYLFLGLLIAVAFLGWKGIAVVITLPLFGWIHLIYKELEKRWRQSAKAVQLNKAELENLLELRKLDP